MNITVRSQGLKRPVAVFRTAEQRAGKALATYEDHVEKVRIFFDRVSVRGGLLLDS